MSLAYGRTGLEPWGSLRQESSAQAYDQAALHYDKWNWQTFWRANEYPVVRKLLLDAKPDAGLLDIGVGTGTFLFYCVPDLKPELRISGIDLSLEMLKRARDQLGSRVSVACCDVQRMLPFTDRYFDACVMMRVANHLSKLECAVAEIWRVLSPGGILIATDLADEFDYLCTRIPTPQATISVETHKHARLKWEQILTKSGFSSVKLHGYNYSNLRDPHAGALDDKFDANSTAPIFQVIIAQKSTN